MQVHVNHPLFDAHNLHWGILKTKLVLCYSKGRNCLHIIYLSFCTSLLQVNVLVFIRIPFITPFADWHRLNQFKNHPQLGQTTMIVIPTNCKFLSKSIKSLAKDIVKRSNVDDRVFDFLAK